jgi:hypothetical protein
VSWQFKASSGTYIPGVGREGDVSDSSYDYQMTAGRKYRLKWREGVRSELGPQNKIQDDLQTAGEEGG